MKPVPLRIIGANEDVPRVLIAAHTGVCQGQAGYFAYAQRPADNVAVLVWQGKGKGTHPMLWETELGLGPSHPPERQTTAEAAVAAHRAAKAAPPAGPSTMRGSWSGVFQCADDGSPRVKLVRKVASYGSLRVESGADGRWTAIVERAERWFGKAKSERAERSSLADAIQAGHGLMVGLVSEACSFRDTRRRNAVDATYAAQHPPKPARGVKDPTEKNYRIRPGPSHIAKRGEHGTWDVVDPYGNVVAAGYAGETLATRAAKRLVKGASVDEVKPKAKRTAKPKAEKPKRTPKPKAEKPAKAPKAKPAKADKPAPKPKAERPAKAPTAAKAPAVDPAKDKALMDAFAAAIAAAAKGRAA